MKFAVLRGPGFKCNARKDFAAAFREWRRQKKIPLKRVAAELGFAVATISKWERGERFPTGENLELIVEYISQPTCHLVYAHARCCHGGGCLLKKSSRG
jgi:hypothetical protein